MKKILVITLILIIVLNLTQITYADTLSIPAETAVLIDAKTGNVLYNKNMDKQMYPASTTKIMTAILALEKTDLDNIVTVDSKTPYETQQGDSSHIALRPGERLTMRDLLHALLIESANDAAVVIARYISGSVEDFSKLMNEKAKEIGAKNTHFTNPNGLPDENHTTTAYDLAIMAKYAMEKQTFREIVSKYKYSISKTNKQPIRYLKSANRLLYGVGASNQINVNGNYVDIKYDGVNGIKTGYTFAAQNCLVSSAKQGNKDLIAVVLHCQGRNVYIATHKLLNYGFENFESKKIAFKREFIENIKVEHGDMPYVTGIIGKDLYINIPKGRDEDVKRNIVLGEKIQAPIKENQVLGKVEYSLDDEILGTTNIVSATNINMKPIYKVVNNTNDSIFKKWWFWIIIIFILWRVFIMYRRYKKKKLRRKKRYNIYNNY
ncbi:MAG: D-alanyl-D-alanine carboxypeptidase [Firmicutes bacterium]|nr:D-alanyl-D-alanine carboxypeptidase [Bacillota bacterium]